MIEDEEEDWIKITPDSGILKKIVRPGTGVNPEPSSTCYIHYVGRTLPSHSIFDDIYQRGGKSEQLFSFELGEGQVIQTFDEVVPTMKKGEISIVKTTPKYAFGKMGCPPRIPPNAPLEFEMEFVTFERKKMQEKKEKQTLEQRKKEALKDRMEGNEHYKKGHFRKASKSYNQALSYFNAMYGLTEEEEEEVNDSKLPLYLNLAACFLKLNEITKAITNAEKALEIDKNNAKAYYRLGQTFAETEDYELAKINLLKAAKLDPNNKELRLEVEKVKEKLLKQKENMKKQPQLFQGMFSKKS